MEVMTLRYGLRESYTNVLYMVADEGRKSAPRGKTTFEIDDAVLFFPNASFPMLPLGTGRGLSPSVAAIEALQLIGAVDRSDLLVKAAPQFERYMEHDYDTGEPTHFHGHYGRRIGNQAIEVVSKLAGSDPHSRQAVITLWDHTLDNIQNKNDYPCTVALGFRRRTSELVGEVLDMRVTMRSNDAWLGLPYDTFQFQQLQWTLANALDVEMGTYLHHAWTLHLYEEDVDKIPRVLAPQEPPEPQPWGLFFDNPVGIVDHMKFAQDLLNGDTEGELSTSQLWYHNVLQPVIDDLRDAG